MSRLTKRFSRSSLPDLPDTTDLRARIIDAVEQALDRMEDIVQDAPTPAEAAGRLRRQRLVRSAGTTIVAVAPTVTRMAKNRHVRRSSRRAAALAPIAMRSHPVLLGVGLAASAVGGVLLLRRMRANQHRGQLGGAGSTTGTDLRLERAHDRYVEDVDPRHFDLEEEVERMEDEGGEPSAGSTQEVGAGVRTRRFVRHRNGSTNGSTTT